MFAFGDDEWPGLAKLAEESGELLSVVGRLMATHGRRVHFDGSDLGTSFLRELADLRAASDFVFDHLSPDERSTVTRLAEGKLRLFQRWHQEAIRPASDSSNSDAEHA